MDMKIKFASYNVRGLKNDIKRRKLFSYLTAKKYDVVCLQETHCEKNDLPKWEKEWKGNIYSNFGTNRSKGTAILMNDRMNKDNIKINKDHDDGRIVSLTYTNDEGLKYYIASIYAPNIPEQRKQFFTQLNNKLLNETDKDTCIMIGGDYNCALNMWKDRTSPTKYPDAGQPELQELIKIHNLEDIWRRRNPDKREYTWDGGDNRCNKSRIDY